MDFKAMCRWRPLTRYLDSNLEPCPPNALAGSSLDGVATPLPVRQLTLQVAGQSVRWESARNYDP